MAALRHFHDDLGDRIWGRFGFIDGFSEQHDWYADSYLAISQGPIVVMIENYRSGLIWKLFMSIPEIQRGHEEAGLQKSAFRFSGIVTALDDWIDKEARFAASAMLRAVSATHLVKERPGFRTARRSAAGIGGGLAGPRRLRSRPRLFLPLVPGFGDRHRRVARGAGGGDSRSEPLSSVCGEFVEFSRCAAQSGRSGASSSTGVSGTRSSPPSCNMCGPTPRSRRSSATRRWRKPASIRTERSISPAGRAPRMMGRRFEFLRLSGGETRSPDLDETLRPAMLELVVGDLDFIRSRAQEPSFDIWEEESGYHYYTQLAQAEALARGAEWLEETGDAVRARACRSVADELAPSLDAYWSAADGYYRSRTGVDRRRPGKGSRHLGHSRRAPRRAHERSAQRRSTRGLRRR